MRFSCTLTIQGFQFTGENSSKKKARNEAVRLAFLAFEASPPPVVHVKRERTPRGTIYLVHRGKSGRVYGKMGRVCSKAGKVCDKTDIEKVFGKTGRVCGKTGRVCGFNTSCEKGKEHVASIY